MQIRIIVDDKMVSVDNSPVEILDLAWDKFAGDPGTTWDDILAVQFDTDVGHGHVEFKEVKTGQVTRPNIRPPDWRISTADFEANFSWVMPFYRVAKERVAAEAKAADEAHAEAQKAAEERAKAALQATVDAHNAGLGLAEQGKEVRPVGITSDELQAALEDQSRAHRDEMAALAASMAASITKGFGGGP